MFVLICLVDYMHSETGATPLMVTAGRGFLSQMERLLNMGADINLKAFNGWYDKSIYLLKSLNCCRSQVKC